MDIRYSFSGNGFRLQHSLDEEPNHTPLVMHNHSQYELYFFIQGNATFFIEGTQYPLQKGDVLVMNSNESHSISVSPGQPYERIVIHFNEELIQLIDSTGKLLAPFKKRTPGQQNHFKKYIFCDSLYSHYFHNMIKNVSNQEIQIISYLFPILNDIMIAFENLVSFEEEYSSSVNKIILYILDNLSQPLSLDYICEKFFISKSLLCTSFKKTIGTSIWNYITIKRLTKAQELISSGFSPSKIYSECGFNDYSTFFRAYKKHFGVSPSKIYTDNNQ